MNNAKVFFPLTENWHGYASETVNCLAEGDYYRIDNIPFFIRGISLGDLVYAEYNENCFTYIRTVNKSGNSTYRVIFNNNGDLELNKNYLNSFLLSQDCDYEGFSRDRSLQAINIPPEANIDAVYNFLAEGETNGRWEFEEGDYGRRGLMAN